MRDEGIMSLATVINVDEEEKPMQQVSSLDRKPPLKRKRAGSAPNPLLNLTTEEKSAQIDALRQEIKALFDFYKEINGNEKFQTFYAEGFTGNMDSEIALLLEESMLPLSNLANEIFEKLKFRNENKGDGGGGVGSLASVKSKVLLIGQRVYYGIPDVDADLLEDDSDSALWCWETKDFKLLPKSLRPVLKTQRTCRGTIKERITAVSALIAALQNPVNSVNHKQVLAKALSKVSKISSEAQIRDAFSTLMDDIGSALVEKSPKQEKLLLKQLEKNKRQEEKERRKLELEQQKEGQQKEKELKRLHEEAEKVERKREKEELDMKKRLRKQQEEEEREQRRKEKEEAELRRLRALQKQASVMDRFLKKAKTIEATDNNGSISVTKSDSSPKIEKQIANSVTHSMDSLLSTNGDVKAEDLWKLHIKSWNSVGHSLRTSKSRHWGIRKKPKTELVKELKLTASKGSAHDDDMSTEMGDDGWPDSNTDTTLYNSQKRMKYKQMLQFDKSYRPAFYGIWPNTSQVIKPRQPFAKDPELDYEIDSDEEWEEDEPGESLSDCDKDDSAENLEEGCSKDPDDDDDESEDGFFVPDGYLSENEGVEVDKLWSKLSYEEAGTQASPEGLHIEELSQCFRQQKYLHNMTEISLRKGYPLFISNFKHEKASLLVDDLTGIEKRDQMCLQALSICPYPTGQVIEISIAADDVKEDQVACSLNGNSTVVASGASILESDLAQFVSIIQSCPHGINKVVESLIDKYPSVSKSQLRNKVREIAEFIDSRWQVKKDILEKLGLMVSPVSNKKSGKTKSISSFFSKRCLPPGAAGNLTGVSPQSSQKTVASSSTPESSLQND